MQQQTREVTGPSPSPSPVILGTCLLFAVTMCSSAGVAFDILTNTKGVPPFLAAFWRLFIQNSFVWRPCTRHLGGHQGRKEETSWRPVTKENSEQKSSKRKYSKRRQVRFHHRWEKQLATKKLQGAHRQRIKLRDIKLRVAVKVKRVYYTYYCPNIALSPRHNAFNMMMTMPMRLFLNRPRNLAFHNLCMQMKLPLTLRSLLGLCLNFCPTQVAALQWLLNHPEIIVFSADKNLGPVVNGAREIPQPRMERPSQW